MFINRQNKRRKLIRKLKFSTIQVLNSKEQVCQKELEKKMKAYSSLEKLPQEEVTTKITPSIQTAIKKICSKQQPLKTANSVLIP